MKLLKFYLKYFVFRSLRKVKNIEAVIQSHGFRIYPFRLIDDEDPVTGLIQDLGIYEYAKHHKCFIATNSIINGVFMKDGLSDDDRLELLFHEEAHIWYNHPNITGFTNDTDTQQEVTANKFLSRLWLLKTITTLVLLAVLAVGIYFFPKLLTTTEIYTLEANIEVEAPLTPAVDPAELSNLVYITKEGNCYHRQDCRHLTGSEIIPFPTELARQIKTPCKTCMPDQ